MHGVLVNSLAGIKPSEEKCGLVNLSRGRKRLTQQLSPPSICVSCPFLICECIPCQARLYACLKLGMDSTEQSAGVML